MKKSELGIMKMSEVKKLLTSGFKEKLTPLGFKKGKHGFIKINGDYSYRFSFSSVDRYDFYPSSFSYALNCKSIGHILKNIISIQEDNYPYYMMMGQNQAGLYVEKNP